MHRIGRTGRAGKAGVAITFVTPREDRQLRLIKSVSKANIQRGRLPTKEQVLEARFMGLKDKISEFIDDPRFDRYLTMAEKISEELKPVEALASLLKFQLEGMGAAQSIQESRASAEESGASAGMVRLFMSIGREQNVNAKDIVAAISKKADIPPQAIKSVNIFDKFTFVDVPRESAEKVIEFMHQTIISGINVAVKHAKPREGGGSGARRHARAY